MTEEIKKIGFGYGTLSQICDKVCRDDWFTLSQIALPPHLPK
jgi:hypothetical protein